MAYLEDSYLLGVHWVNCDTYTLNKLTYKTYKVLIRNLRIQFHQQKKRWTTEQAGKYARYKKELKELQQKELVVGPNYIIRGKIVL